MGKIEIEKIRNPEILDIKGPCGYVCDTQRSRVQVKEHRGGPIFLYGILNPFGERIAQTPPSTPKSFQGAEKTRPFRNIIV